MTQEKKTRKPRAMRELDAVSVAKRKRDDAKAALEKLNPYYEKWHKAGEYYQSCEGDYISALKAALEETSGGQPEEPYLEPL